MSGQTFSITLGGVALADGLLVDEATVTVEISTLVLLMAAARPVRRARGYRIGTVVKRIDRTDFAIQSQLVRFSGS